MERDQDWKTVQMMTMMIMIMMRRAYQSEDDCFQWGDA